MTTFAIICGWISVGILALLSVLFWSNPERGMEQTTHRMEGLPWVMANRYTAFMLLGLAITLKGDLTLLAVFFGVCALMGFADGVIYARAKHPHIKHTISGVLALVALCITLAASAGQAVGGVIGEGFREGLSQIPD